MFMPHKENVFWIVDTSQNSVKKRKNLEVPPLTSVSNLDSKLHFSEKLGNVFVLNLSIF
tara:strand:- start:590 stop:766 length:177 start_codon:yes stop_codon:yes gene_type:complete